MTIVSARSPRQYRFLFPGKFLIVYCGTHQSEVICFQIFFFFHSMFRVFSINHARQSRNVSVSMQSSIYTKLAHASRISIADDDFGHAAARQPEKQDNCGDSQFVSFLCYPLNT